METEDRTPVLNTVSFLPRDTFLTVLDSAPLVAVDLILRDAADRALLGFRANQPARGFWFVPGGRIRKNEKLADAVSRISQEELGTTLSPNDLTLQGVYEHFYDSNSQDEPGISTHYVTIGYAGMLDGVSLKTDAQHERFEWFDLNDLLARDDVHPYAKDYFR